MIEFEKYKDIFNRLRKLPERTDLISAYGWDLDYDGEVFSDFYELVCKLIREENFNEELAIAFIQLYSWDFQNSHEGLYTFYENRYASNSKESVNVAIQWLTNHNHISLGRMIKEGYNEKCREDVSDWIYDNTETIYIAYRDIMFQFEKKYM